MTTKAELIGWDNACQAFDRQDFEAALSEFDQITECAKIHFNIGVTLTAVQEYDAAINAFMKAIDADQYFALAYFQKGVASFLLGSFEEAVEDFSSALSYLRGNLLIDYQQLGLDYKLYSSEVLYNRGLCFVYMNDEQSGAADLYAAQKEKQTPDHEVIDMAIKNGIEGLSVFSLPPGLIYRPPAGKVKNSGKMAHLGQSKLVAASSATDMYIGFKGSHERRINTITFNDDLSFGPASIRARPVEPATPVLPNKISAYRRPSNASANADANGAAAAAAAQRALSVRTPSNGRANPPAGRLRSYSTSRVNSPPVQRREGKSRSYSASRANLPPLQRRMTEGSVPRAALRLADTGESGDNELSDGIYSGEDSSIAVLRVKCHFTDTRVIACDPRISFEELSEKIQRKFSCRSPLKLKYKDEDQELVMLGDDDDLALARTFSQKEDKLNVWCFDVL